MKKISSMLLSVILSTTIFAQEGGKISSLAFYEYTYHTNGDPTVNNEFEFQRVYFTYENSVSDNLEYKFQLDVGRKSDDGRLEAYLKNAVVNWHTDYGNFIIGLQSMNMFNIQEKNWGHRFIEKTPMDINKFSSSADLAIGYENSLNYDLHFSLLLSNGEGYKSQEKDAYKKVSANLVYGVSDLTKKDGFNLGGVVSFEPFENKVGTDVQKENSKVFGLFGGYAFSNLRVGAEYDIQTTSGVDITANIISAYANYKLIDWLQGFARLDIVDPNSDTDRDANNYFVAGAIFSPTKGLKISPNIRYTSFENNDIESITDLKLNFEFKI
ncbi:MAG: hypothetical protein CVV23_04690 [Ignavibacteriae bacterium HGW-Ignavibacteriae-2]|jgi:hypothetical protein|nr:MAG: hypothetical protein CVV23_04690 [Ignavibacteriae bacterium HGW-Ignavibacteriae-2]